MKGLTKKFISAILITGMLVGVPAPVVSDALGMEAVSVKAASSSDIKKNLKFSVKLSGQDAVISFTGVDEALSYNIYRKTTGKFKLIDFAEAGDTKYIDEGLAELKKYTYKVSAIIPKEPEPETPEPEEPAAETETSTDGAAQAEDQQTADTGETAVQTDGAAETSVQTDAAAEAGDTSSEEQEDEDEEMETEEVFYNNGKSVSIQTSLKPVVVKSAEAVKVSAKIKWKKKKKADGYVIYRRPSDSSDFSIVKKIKDNTTVSYLDESVKLDETYVYKVVAYANVSGKTYRSKDSNYEKCKVALKMTSKKVTDKNSSVYGKKIGSLTFADGSQIDDIEKYLSESDKDYVIYVNKAKGQTTVYATRGATLIPVQSFICSPGQATPIGTHNTITKLRWHELMGPCWGQWCTKVVSNGIYFHSIFYNSYNNNKRLSVTAYNRLGTVCSHGCIRLQAYAAKWIYDNCEVGTKVVVCSKGGYEPMRRPSITALPSWHTWDPTDPGAVKYCKQNHCHGY